MERLEQLARAVKALAPVPDREIQSFFEAGRPLALAADEPFIAFDERHHRLGFIHRGLVRLAVATADGEEVIKDFAVSGTFTVSYGSAILGEPARVAVIAVEPCELTVWSWPEVQAGYERHPAWERFGRRTAELLYVRKERRELSFLLQGATERYAACARELGPVLSRIPQYQLASYLGIAPESLSRLRGRAKRKRTT